MSYKKWIFYTLFLTIFTFLSVGAFNYIIDPFNIFSHKNRFNKLQIGFNERLQKSAYLKYNSDLNYDSILLGSSRATYYDPNAFKGMKLYNYSFSGAMPQEYSSYLEFAKKLNKKKFKNIILALDFYTFDSNKKIETFIPLNESKFMFFIENYFTLDILKFSIVNIKRSVFNTTSHRSYTRENIVKADKVDEAKVEQLATQRAKKYYLNFDTNKNTYYSSLIKFKNSNLDSNFIVFIPPLSQPFLDTLFHDNSLSKHYFDWLNVLIDIFGEIYTFSLPNKWAINYQEYSIDGDHFYPSVCNEIANEVVDKTGHRNNMMVINKSNINSFKLGYVK